MSLKGVVFVVLMILWLFGGGYHYYGGPGTVLVMGHILPWCCVAILGWLILGDGKR